MKTKKTSQLEDFANKVEQLSKKHLDDKMGYMLFTYDLIDNRTMNRGFAAQGKQDSMADCVLSAMLKHESLAYILTAAVNAYGHMRMMQAQQAMNEEKKPKIVS